MGNVTLKTCATCGREQAASEFYADTSTADGLKPGCKTCLRAARKAREGHNKAEKKGILNIVRSTAPADAPPQAAPVRRLKHINGGYLNLPERDATRAQLEEFFTKLHMTFCAAGPADRVTIFKFLNIPVPPKLTVLHSPQLCAFIVQYSHGFGARGWGQVHAWGELPALSPEKIKSLTVPSDALPSR